MVQPDKQFIEYTPDGVATAFTVQSKRACQWYEFTMENRYLSGRWTGKFEALGPYTRVVFTEYVEAKSIWRKPFVKRYLQKQQARYMEDLVRALKQQQ